MRSIINKLLETPVWLCPNCRFFSKGKCTRPDIPAEDKIRLEDWPSVDEDDTCSVWEKVKKYENLEEVSTIKDIDKLRDQIYTIKDELVGMGYDFPRTDKRRALIQSAEAFLEKADDALFEATQVK